MLGIDTNIVIQILRSRESVEKLQLLHTEDLCTCEVVVYELLYGVHKARLFSAQRLKEIEAILDTFVYIFPLDRRASLLAAEIAGELTKSGRMIEHRDAMIAGCLLANGCKKLLTQNTKDFENIPQLRLVEL